MIYWLFTILAAGLFFQGSAFAATKTIAILPFEINSKQDISYMKKGVSRMLYSRLAWKDHVIVAPESAIPKEIKQFTSIRDNDTAAKVAAATRSDYVLLGSITEFAGAYSLDTKVFDIEKGTVQSFFGQAGSLDGIIPEMNIITATINNKIFNRTTSVIEPSKKNIIKPEIQSLRANPELMMRQKFPIEPTEKEKPPFWKFWAKEKPAAEDWDAYDGEDEEFTAATERPFWKFWGSDNTDEEYGFEEDVMDDFPKKRPFWKFWGSDIDEEEPDEWIEGEAVEDKPFWKFW